MKQRKKGDENGVQRSARFHMMGREDKREKLFSWPCPPKTIFRRLGRTRAWPPTLVSRFEYKCEIFTARCGERKGKPRLRATFAIYIPLRAFIAPFCRCPRRFPWIKMLDMGNFQEYYINLSSHISCIFYVIVVRLIWSSHLYCIILEFEKCKHCAIRWKKGILEYHVVIIMYL